MKVQESYWKKKAIEHGSKKYHKHKAVQYGVEAQMWMKVLRN